MSTVDGIMQVDSTAGVFVDGTRTREAINPDRLESATGTRLEAIPSRDVLAGTDVAGLLDRLRAVPAPIDDLLVGGYPAELTDFRATLMDRLPLVAVLVPLVTFVVLFLMSGSLLIPVKATVLNLLSVAAMIGALVFVFQNGGPISACPPPATSASGWPGSPGPGRLVDAFDVERRRIERDPHDGARLRGDEPSDATMWFVQICALVPDPASVASERPQRPAVH